MLTDFYTAFSPACFSLLGLWLVVITINASAWLDPGHQAHVYAVALYFAAPGTMSLLALTNPLNTLTWRISFIIVSLLGGAGLYLFSRVHYERAHDRLEVIDHVVQWIAIGLYLAIAVLAVIPRHTLRTEGVLLTVLVLLGVHVALRLMFTVGAPPPKDPDTSSRSVQPQMPDH
jgi:hypothetical protein